MYWLARDKFRVACTPPQNAHRASNRADFKCQASSFAPPGNMRASEIQGGRVLTWLILEVGQGACHRSATCRLRPLRPPLACSRRVPSSACAPRRDPTRFRQLAMGLWVWLPGPVFQSPGLGMRCAAALGACTHQCACAGAKNARLGVVSGLLHPF